MQNKTIIGYTLKYRLGSGGMAEVWYAENGIGKKAAVKILKEEFTKMATVLERFKNEAQVMVTLSHPHIRQVYDYGTIDGRPCIVMEYLDGADLSVRMKRGERFGDEQLVHWWNIMADVLQYTHRQGVVRRDIKPSNIFITETGDLKLLDFGIAKIKSSITLTQTGNRMGTLMYMSPEQVKDSKHLDYRTDCYSLAITFHHLLSGVAPYDLSNSSEFDVQLKIVQEPVDVSVHPKHWQDRLKPLLRKEPEKRGALLRFGDIQASDSEATRIEEEPIRPQPAPKPQPQPTSPLPPDVGHEGSKTKKGLWIGLGAAAVVAIVFALTINKGDRNAEPMTSDVSVGLAETKNGVDIEMVPVEGGTFTMGCTNEQGDDCWDDEKPAHSVTLSGFYMGKYEVTQAQWKAVMGSNPSRFKGDNLPVENVSWDDVQAFIRKLNQLTGKRYRLPTEAEWEYAARGGNQSRGYKYAGGNDISSVAWYDGNSGERTHPVGKKRPNELGLYDMSGNVWEWCSDWYDEDYYGNSPQNNPQGPASGSFRVGRGGSWGHIAIGCRSAYRDDDALDYRSDALGFRLVLVP